VSRRGLVARWRPQAESKSKRTPSRGPWAARRGCAGGRCGSTDRIADCARPDYSGRGRPRALSKPRDAGSRPRHWQLGTVTRAPAAQRMVGRSPTGSCCGRGAPGRAEGGPGSRWTPSDLPEQPGPTAQRTAGCSGSAVHSVCLPLAASGIQAALLAVAGLSHGPCSPELCCTASGCQCAGTVTAVTHGAAMAPAAPSWAGPGGPGRHTVALSLAVTPSQE
jgi:hypothetical protein